MRSPLDLPAGKGISRRSFFRFAAGASTLATLPILTEAHLAWAGQIEFADSNKGIHIDANENPLGPSEAARKAIMDIIPSGGRYKLDLSRDVAATFAGIEGLNPEFVMAFPGSSAPLHYTVFAFTDAHRPVVLADPGGAATHDVKAMVAASTNPGVIYICNPNNPTGTTTNRADIEFAVANAPKCTILLIDEAC